MAERHAEQPPVGEGGRPGAGSVYRAELELRTVPRWIRVVEEVWFVVRTLLFLDALLGTFHRYEPCNANLVEKEGGRVVASYKYSRLEQGESAVRALQERIDRWGVDEFRRKFKIQETSNSSQPARPKSSFDFIDLLAEVDKD